MPAYSESCTCQVHANHGLGTVFQTQNNLSCETRPVANTNRNLYLPPAMAASDRNISADAESTSPLDGVVSPHRGGAHSGPALGLERCVKSSFRRTGWLGTNSVMSRFINSKTFSDVTIHYGHEGERIFHGHKVALCRRSKWFQAALMGSFSVSIFRSICFVTTLMDIAVGEWSAGDHST